MHIDFCGARPFADKFEDGSIHLLLTDPPYGDIIDEAWDRQWKTPADYAAWWLDILMCWRPKLAPTGSLIFFGGTGAPHKRMLLHAMLALEENAALDLHFRQWITWRKRRAYGKSHDYLYTREEIVWYSASAERTEVTFNIPYLNEKRGYAGWDPDHPAKSEMKRVNNVWMDIECADPIIEITELMRPSRAAEKPVPLMERLVLTHSNEGELVVDPFCGVGPTGVAALKHKRRFRGADTDPEAVLKAAERCAAVTAA